MPIPKKQPAILPIEVESGVRASLMPCFRIYWVTLPSHKPAKPSVIASPAAPPTIAPSTPAKLAPIIAAIPKKLVSIAPKTMSAEHDLIVLPEPQWNHGEEPEHEQGWANQRFVSVNIS